MELVYVKTICTFLMEWVCEILEVRSSRPFVLSSHVPLKLPEMFSGKSLIECTDSIVTSSVAAMVISYA